MALPYDLDHGTGHQARVGFVVLQADETLEPDAAAVLGQPGVALHHARIPSGQEVTTETLTTMETDFPKTLAMLPKGLKGIGYGCTSATTLIGRAKVAEIAAAAHSTVPFTEPVSAALAAFHALNVKRIAVVTPYAREVSDALLSLFRDEGMEVTAFASFEQPHEATVARISPASILTAVRDTGANADSDAVFISCTNLNTLGMISKAEATLDKPVISSNSALLWHLAKLSKVAPVSRPGRLFACDPKARP